jgi:hypothetical protein
MKDAKYRPAGPKLTVTKLMVTATATAYVVTLRSVDGK